MAHEPTEVQPEGWPVVKICATCNTAWPCKDSAFTPVIDVLMDVMTEIAIAEVPDERVPQLILDELADRGYTIAQVR